MTPHSSLLLTKETGEGVFSSCCWSSWLKAGLVDSEEEGLRTGIYYYNIQHASTLDREEKLIETLRFSSR